MTDFQSEMREVLVNLCEDCNGEGYLTYYMSGDKYEDPEKEPCTNELHERIPQALTSLTELIEKRIIGEDEYDERLNGVDQFHPARVSSETRNTLRASQRKNLKGSNDV